MGNYILVVDDKERRFSWQIGFNVLPRLDWSACGLAEPPIVVAVISIEEIAQVLAQHGRSPALVVSGVLTGGRISGVAVYNEVRRLCPIVPFVFTALDRVADIDACPDWHTIADEEGKGWTYVDPWGEEWHQPDWIMKAISPGA